MCNKMKSISNKLLVYLFLITLLSPSSWSSDQEGEPRAQRIKFVSHIPNKYVKPDDTQDDILAYAPTYDTIFKKLFGSPDSIGSTTSFLNNLLFKGETIITQLSLRGTERATFKAKKLVFDVCCELKEVDLSNAIIPAGTWFIIEMQRASQANFVKRVMTYSGCHMSDQWDAVSTKRGSEVTYGDMRPVWTVSIIDFYLSDEYKEAKKSFPVTWGIKDEDDKDQQTTNMFKWTFLELPKVREAYFSTRQVESTAVDGETQTLYHITYKQGVEKSEYVEWLCFLGLKENYTVPINFFDANTIVRDVCCSITLNSEEKELLDQEVKNKAIEIDTVQAAEQRGREEGIERGAIRNALQTAFDQWNDDLLQVCDTAKKVKFLFKTDVLTEVQKERFGQLMDDQRSLDEIMSQMFLDFIDQSSRSTIMDED